MSRYRSAGALLVLLGCAGWSAPVGAAERLLALGVDAGLGTFDGDAAATLQTGLDIREGNLALGLYGRVRLLLAGEEGGGVRQRDYDEPSDYVHLLRYLHYRRAFGQVRLRVGAGELLGFTLGQGTLLRDYSNVADPDHPHAGVMLELEAGPVEVRALLDNVVDPAVIAGRVGWRPEQHDRLSVGASLLIDPRAPRAVRLDEAGRRRVDSAYNLQVDGEALVFSGLDLAYRLGDVGAASLTPYAAANTSWLGVGVHLGATARAMLWDTGVELATQLEYRGTTGGYAPGYVGPFYDVERYQTGLNFHDPERARPSQRATPLSNLHDRSYGGHGFLGQVSMDAGRPLQAKLGYSYHPGPPGHRVWLRASTTPIDRLHVGAMVALSGIGVGMQGAAGLAVLGEGRYRLSDHFYALAQFSRVWAIDAQTHYFAPLSSFNLALGGSWSD